MQDPNWDLINGQAAHEIEYINYTNTVNVIEALVIFYTGVSPQGPQALCPTPIILQELHRSGTLFLLAHPGLYRSHAKINVTVSRPDGTVAHQPPAWSEVDGMMESFYVELNAGWPTWDPITTAAFVLWRINWIHPFKNGNGRSARAFAYACLCLKVGFFLPGSPTVIDQIMTDRKRYEAALKAADDTFKTTGRANLDLMKTYLAELLTNQLSSLPAAGPNGSNAGP